jgi:ABC-type multidrug transport system ATPase subunit
VLSVELNLFSQPSDIVSTGNYLRLWGLSHISNRQVRELTSEEHMRLGLALAMIGEPRLLVLDSIDKELTFEQAKYLITYLKNIAAEKDLAILVSCREEGLALLADTYLCLPKPGRRTYE